MRRLHLHAMRNATAMGQAPLSVRRLLLMSLVGVVLLGMLSCGINIAPDGWPQRSTLPLTSDFVVHLLTIVGATLGLLGASLGLSLMSAQRRNMSALLAARRPASAPLRSAARDLVPLNRLYELAVDAPLAMCVGWRRPAIYVSQPLLRLEPDALRAVLAHEEAHRRSGDPLRLLLWRTLARLAVGIPIVSDLTERLELRAEVAADRFARQQVSRAALAQALLAMTSPLPVSHSPNRYATPSPNMASGTPDTPLPLCSRVTQPQLDARAEARASIQTSHATALFTERLRYLQRSPRTPLPSPSVQRALLPASAFPALRLLASLLAAPAALALLFTVSMVPTGIHLLPTAYACMLHA